MDIVTEENYCGYEMFFHKQHLMVAFVLTVTLWIKSNCYWFLLGHWISAYKTVLLDIIGQSRSNNISNEEGKSGTFSSHYKVYIGRKKIIKVEWPNMTKWNGECTHFSIMKGRHSVK